MTPFVKAIWRDAPVVQESNPATRLNYNGLVNIIKN